MHLGDYVVTERSFGGDRWRKILDIKVPSLGKAPDAVVIVATIRALKMHGGLAKDQLAENLPALQKLCQQKNIFKTCNVMMYQ